MPDFEMAPLHEMTRELAATARGDPAQHERRCAGLAYRLRRDRREPHDRGREPDSRGGEKVRRAGFLGGHCHIESCQITVTQFARAVLPLGTTGGFFDAHEIR